MKWRPAIKSCTGGYDYRTGLFTSGNSYTYKLIGDTVGTPIMCDGITVASGVDGNHLNQRPHPYSYRRGFINILYGDGHVISFAEGAYGSATNLWGCDGGTANTEPCYTKMPKG